MKWNGSMQQNSRANCWIFMKLTHATYTVHSADAVSPESNLPNGE